MRDFVAKPHLDLFYELYLSGCIEFLDFNNVRFFSLFLHFNVINRRIVRVVVWIFIN
jgi:hypothetical protein